MIGRIQERQELEASLSATEAQLIAVCGRRRVGRSDFVGEASGGIPEFETRNLAHKLAGTSEERR